MEAINENSSAMGVSGMTDEMADNYSIEKQLTEPLKLGYYIVGIPLSLILIITNIILIAAISRCRQLASKLNIIACNVALCDLLLGVMLLVNISLLHQHPGLAQKQHTVCTVVGLLELLPAFTGFIFLTLVHIDRFLAVCVPTVYPDLWSTKRVVTVCASIWIFGLAFSSLAFAFNRSPTTPVCDVLFLPSSFLLLSSLVHIIPMTTINIALYLKIKHMLKVHQRKIQVTNTLTYSNLVDDTQLARLFFILTILCFVAWLPFMICVILWFCDMHLDGLMIGLRATFLLGHIAGLKLVVYVAESSTYHCAVKRLFKCQKKPGSSHNIRGSSGVQ